MATAEALAVRALTHLGSETVAEVAGSEYAAGGVDVLITTDEPNGGRVYVNASPSTVTQGACGLDSGYSSVLCETDPRFKEIVKRNRSAGPLPVYIARTQTADRGAVMIQIHGTPPEDPVQLLTEMLDDELIGLVTPPV